MVAYYRPDDPIRIDVIPLPKSGSTTKIAGSPGLITSTGGLSGTLEALVTPVINGVTGTPYLILHDSNNFNCEESCEYDYRQEANFGEIPGEGREAIINRLVLKYRELGNAKFSINITVFKKLIDDFVTISIPVVVPCIPLKGTRLRNFPDNRIHTVILRPPKGVVQGERPQVTITRDGDTGPMEVTKLVLCGSADETPEM